jgi:hypothetical protein
MKTDIKAVLFSLIITGMVTVFAYAQSGTVTGNYCGSTYGNHGGTFAFRVGPKERDFEMDFNKVKWVRFDLTKLRVGDEYIIKYRRGDDDENIYIRSITGTGKRKRVSPCNMD